MLNCIFIDSIFLSSFLAVTLICMTTALWGTLLLVGRQPLLSESLSHASYPGLLLGALLSCKVSFFTDSILLVIIFGCLAAISGYGIIVFLEKTLRVHKDASLCFVLVVFFGLGVILTSYVKDSCPLLYNRINAYLYGQAATLGYVEAKLAAFVFLLSITTLWWWYRQIIVTIFDKDYASTCGLSTRVSGSVILIFISLVIVSGVRSVGIILISSMFVAPPLAARQLSDRLNIIFLLSCLFGGICGALGSYISVAFTCHVSGHGGVITFPTGPLVVVISGCLTLLCLIFSPKSGWVTRYIRRKYFAFSKNQEHLLKVFWYLLEDQIPEVGARDFVCSHKYQEYFGPKPFPRLRIWLLECQGLVKCRDYRWSLSSKGKNRAKKLVRAHRLWECYLVRSLEFKEEEVHGFAEEMEHVLTDELDYAITEILDNPHYDPHDKIIPEKPQTMEEL
ncbi:MULTISPECIES: metal ABC transporter permease [Chlamydia]|uniref:Iron ABC transporter n=1 Tax=Chlamydophila parapsittaci TaxID=344886 RepID=A0ABX5VYY7_9CHLA|nr:MULTISPECIES: metal ABC transporter permease [Chlamydia]AFS22673.1 iron dependent repressor, metal binding and dimerization domain protein [Chlamydia psittaci VS225]EPJ15530.1 iron dependent repressor, metal binding and dimerization domain protein [Chlamydia psittaci 02DC18]EPJ16767.1 iron dependent repressor, metal binding and dimerization domain protein [Chlamydia psittaci 02DC22]EPJ20132.1 iron dependent repressor, metal binding and dimerization domain protein [Chlamydia psittaci 02DC21]